MLDRILIATDFSQASERALALAVEIGARCGSQLMLLHVLELPPYSNAGQFPNLLELLSPLETAARERLDQTIESLPASSVEPTAMLRTGEPWREILATVDELEPDLVVLGTHGRGRIERALLGSVAERMVRLARVPVLTARELEGRAGP